MVLAKLTKAGVVTTYSAAYENNDSTLLSAPQHCSQLLNIHWRFNRPAIIKKTGSLQSGNTVQLTTLLIQPINSGNYLMIKLLDLVEKQR